MEEYAEVRARTPTRVRFPGTPKLRGITVTVRVLGIKMKRTSFNSLKRTGKTLNPPKKEAQKNIKVHNTIHKEEFQLNHTYFSLIIHSHS